MPILDFITGINSVTEGSTSSYAGTTASVYTGDYAEEAVTVQDSDPPFELNLGSQTDVWVSFSLSIYSSVTFSNINQVVAFKDSNGDVVARIRSDTSEQLHLEIYNGSTWDTVASFTYVGATRMRIDIHFSLDDTTGKFEFYQDKISLGSFTGDTIRHTYTDIATVELSAASSIYYWLYASVFAANEESLPITMFQHSITGNGTFETDFGGGYTGIDHEGVLDDTNPVMATAVDGQQTYLYDDVNAALAGMDVIGVGVSLRAATVSGSAITGIAPIMSDGTNVAEGTNKALAIAPNFTRHVFSLAPDGTAWSVAKVNAAEVGFKAKG